MKPDAVSPAAHAAGATIWRVSLHARRVLGNGLRMMCMEVYDVAV